MLNLSLPWWEFVIRGVAVYLFLFIILRLLGKKQVGQLSPLDLVLLLILSNAVQNSMNGGDNSLVGGLISATSLVLFNWFMTWALYKSKKLDLIVEGEPVVFIHNGKLFNHVIEKEKITIDEVQAVLRRNGLMNVNEVQYGVIESTGSISIVPKK